MDALPLKRNASPGVLAQSVSDSWALNVVLMRGENWPMRDIMYPCIWVCLVDLSDNTRTQF